MASLTQSMSGLTVSTPMGSSVTIVSIEETEEEEEEICVVCMGCITNRGVLESCSHAFCCECILEWSKKYRRCPICKKDSLLLLTNIQSNGTYTVLELPEPVKKEVDIVSDLEALDQTYFLTESHRLLLVATEKQRNMEKLRRINNSMKYRDSWESRNFELLGDVVSRLRSYIEVFEVGHRVEPLQILQDLYGLEEQLKTITVDPDSRLLEEYYKSHQTNSKDVEYFSDDDDDYYFEEEYTTKKQTRKPNGRRSSTDVRGTPKKSPKRP